jgi:hypothetical protein
VRSRSESKEKKDGGIKCSTVDSRKLGPAQPCMQQIFWLIFAITTNFV